MKYTIAIEGKKFQTEVSEVYNGVAQVLVNGKNYSVAIEGYDDRPTMPQPAVVSKPAPVEPAPKKTVAPPPPVQAPAAPAAKKAAAGSGNLSAPIPGTIMDILVKEGDSVKIHQTVAIIEAMKMENSLVSNINGKVKQIFVQKGAQVATGDPIMSIE